MASTTNDGGKVTAASAPTDKAIVTSSRTKAFHLRTEQTCDVPSRRPGEIFDFMALTGELRNAIYQAVIDTMATTADNPIVLIEKASSSRKYVSCDHGLDRIPVEELAEMTRTTKLRRTNLATCRLGEVSRQIRSEFVPMLLDSLHFRICICAFCSAPIQAPIQQLAGMIRHLDYYTPFWPTLDPAGDLPQLFDTLLSLRFKGELKIVGYHDHTPLVLDCFDIFCSTVLEGKSSCIAHMMAFEAAHRGLGRFGSGPSGPVDNCKQVLVFRFNCSDFLGDHVQT